MSMTAMTRVNYNPEEWNISSGAGKKQHLKGFSYFYTLFSSDILMNFVD
jgi:hypothetical protein